MKNAQMELDLRDEVITNLQERISQVQHDLSQNPTSNDVKLSKVISQFPT
jgi:hypothetical protein